MAIDHSATRTDRTRTAITPTDLVAQILTIAAVWDTEQPSASALPRPRFGWRALFAGVADRAFMPRAVAD
jgi:hypothetical protein